MDRATWRRDELVNPEKDAGPERPLLVWPQDDTPRMGRGAGAAYLAFLVLLAFGAVWVLERDIEGPTPSVDERASNEPPITGAELPRPVELEQPTSVPDLGDLPPVDVGRSAAVDLPAAPVEPPAVPEAATPPPRVTTAIPRNDRPAQSASPSVSRVRPPLTPPVRPPLAVTPTPKPPPRATTSETSPSPPPRIATTEPAPLPPPRVTTPEPAPAPPPRVSTPEPAPAPPPRVTTSEPAPSQPRVATAEPAPSPLPRVSVDDPLLVPPATPPPAAAVPPANAGAAAAVPTPSTPRSFGAAPSNASRAAIEVENAAIRDVLGRYRSAFNALDSKAALQVWPTVNQRTLERAFGQLQEQNVSFDRCAIDVKGPIAQANCIGNTRFVPKVGSRSPQVETRQWVFSLRKASSTGWQIQEVQAR